MERRDGHDVYDQGGSSAPSTSGLLCVAATTTRSIIFEILFLVSRTRWRRWEGCRDSGARKQKGTALVDEDHGASENYAALPW